MYTHTYFLFDLFYLHRYNFFLFDLFYFTCIDIYIYMANEKKTDQQIKTYQANRK